MNLKQTPLHQFNLNEGCKMMPFAGWEMPIQYSGLVKEHLAVRTKAGVFDISHMGVLQIQGKGLKNALQKLVPSDLGRIGPEEACYSVLLNNKGGILDDLIIYDLGVNNNGDEDLIIVINAACFNDDFNWLKSQLKSEEFSIIDLKKDKIFMALQGPKAQEILQRFCEEPLQEIPKFGHKKIMLKDNLITPNTSIFIARTGYTGEDGFELLLPIQSGQILWKKLINNEVTPCGLGARDTLRLEAGLHLYGHEMDQTTTPYEAGLGWLIHLEMTENFFGRAILEKQAQIGIEKKLVGMKLEGRAIARHNYSVLNDNVVIGKVTSGTWSPSLKEPIAMAYVPIELSQVGTRLFVDIRGQQHPAKIVKKPFYKRN